jgi:hypothetical protein
LWKTLVKVPEVVICICLLPFSELVKVIAKAIIVLLIFIGAAAWVVIVLVEVYSVVIKVVV